MYSREDLELKKYGELLHISKELGIKRGKKLKTAKVIEQILEKQNFNKENVKAPSSPSPQKSTENINSSTITLEEPQEDVFFETDSILMSPSPKRSVKKTPTNSPPILSKVESTTKKRKASPVSESNVLNTTPSRSATFVLEGNNTQHGASPLLATSPKTTLNRSATFTLNSSVTLQNAKPANKIDNYMTLECDEIQTAEDIESLETAKKEASPNSAPIRGRKVMRRSLRGQLLESKVSSGQRSFLSLSSPSKSVPSPLASKRSLSSPFASPDEKTKKVAPNDKTTNIQNAFEASKKSATGGQKGTSIPRFVAFARTVKMPNFAKIHENAFKKMEAIDEYADRKHVRSNSVKERLGSAIKTQEKKNAASQKTPAIKEIQSEEKENQTIITNAAERSAASPPLRNSNTRKTNEAVPHLRKSPTSPLRHTFKSALPQLIKEKSPKTPNRWNKTQVDPNTPGSLQRRMSYNPSKLQEGFNNITSRGKACSQKTVKMRSGQSAQMSRKDTLKQIVKKKPIVKSRSEMRASSKMFIKGVRTNRRFELLMAKRGIQV